MATTDQMTQEILNSSSAWIRGITAVESLYKDAPTREELMRHRPAYRQASRLMTGLKGSQLESYVDRTMMIQGENILKYFGDASTGEELNDGIANFVKFNSASMKQTETAFEQATRNEVFDTQERDPRDSRRLVLRSRFTMAGPDDVAESAGQSVADVVQSDLFSYKDTNDDNGIYNSVRLDQLRNHALQTSRPGMPRPPSNLEQLILPFETLPQFKDQQNVSDEIHDKVIAATVQGGLMYGAPRSIALQDETRQVDPFGLSKTQDTYLKNVNTLQPGFRPDYCQGVAFGELDRVGFKTKFTSDNPMEPENNKFIPPMSAQRMVDIEMEGRGFDYLY